MNKDQKNTRGVYDLFTRISEHHSDHIADTRLHLPRAPVRAMGVAHKHSRFKDKMTHSFPHNATPTPEQTPNAALELSALVASRICHDIVSPMGAIGNGLELLELSQTTTSPEIDLIRQSIASANARLRFYRIAFGTITADQRISASEILSVLTALGAVQKQNVHWDPAADLSRRQVKLAFLLIMCLESALPWGGDIHMHNLEDGFELVATADRFKIDDALWSALEHGGGDDGMSSAKVQFAASIAEMVAQNARITVCEAPTGLYVRVVFA